MEKREWLRNFVPVVVFIGNPYKNIPTECEVEIKEAIVDEDKKKIFLLSSRTNKRMYSLME